MFYICGHKNPDTDSIVSAIVMEDYFKKLGEKAKAIRVGKINRETEFVLKQNKIKSPVLIKKLSGKEVFLVDHNELEQAGDGIDKAKIIGVLDHHRIGGGISTDGPIYFRVEPVGCTSTLIFKLFQEKEILLNKKQAFLLLCAILSDTLKFNSPTTTKEDIKIAKKLSEICKQNINNLAEKMFKAKSDISGIDIKDLEAVINFEITPDPEIHIHRIGRTGRAGNEGLALTLFMASEAHRVNRIEEYQNTTFKIENTSHLKRRENFKLSPSMVTLSINGGRKNKVRAGDILGALTAKTTLPGKQIGKIDIFDMISYVAIERPIAKQALKILSEGKIKGRKFKVRKLS